MATEPGNSGIRRLWRAAGYSWRGLCAAARHETAFRQELALSVLLLPLAVWLGNSGQERALLVAAWMLVLLFELANSAIEAVVDRIGPERHELAGRAKDIGSAAVLVAILNAAAVWLLVLW